MRPTAGQLSGRNSARSSRFAKSVASTIVTSDGRPDPAQAGRRHSAVPHRAGTLPSLYKDTPHGRRLERPELGRVFPILEVAGLHHRFVPTGRLIQPSRFATISPVLPSGCSPPHPKRSASFSGGPTDLL